MSKGHQADATVCRNYCAYYKPGKNEELACQGYVAVLQIIDRGRALPRERPERVTAPDARALEALRERVCGRCSFREADCDYIATEGKAPACGGFVLLAHLVGTGDLALDEIE